MISQARMSNKSPVTILLRSAWSAANDLSTLEIDSSSSGHNPIGEDILHKTAGVAQSIYLCILT